MISPAARTVASRFLCSPRKNPGCVLITLILLELLLAYRIPPDLLSQSAMLAGLVNAVQGLAPVLGKVPQYSPENAEVIRLYMALTLLLVPFKVALFYLWLNSDRNGIYRFLVITPLTDTKPAGGDNFVTDPLRQERKEPPKAKRRSVFSRLFWSTLILLLTVGSGLAILISTDPQSSNPKAVEFYRDVAPAGLAMWFTWVIKNLSFWAFFLAVSASILKDYLILFGRGLAKLRRVGHE